MIESIDIKTIENVINILSELKEILKEIKYDCETCKHEISSICLDCDFKNKSKGWEPKEEK